MNSINFLSLFSGIGGFELGLMSSSLNAKCVGFSEIDKNAMKVYQDHFPDHVSLGDITMIDPHKLDNFDMLVGGFPCQSYSIAGQRKGLDDERGKLFYDILKIVEVKKPKVLFLENVKGLTNHDQGKTYWYILQKLREEGYKVFSKVLVSSLFQVPHKRERVYIVMPV